MDWASSLMGSTMMSPVVGAGIMGLGSFLGTQQNNAASAANINNQWLANSGLMNQQTTSNWQTMDKQQNINFQTMDKQFAENSQLMDKQAGINSAAAQWAFDRSQQQLQEVQGYNTSMANTAYQRMSQDMRAAGLNPILGISSGGASTPGLSANSVAAPTVSGSGVSALGVGAPGTSGSSVNTPQTQSALANAISSAAQGAKLFAGIKQANADADNASVQTDILNQNKREAAANADTAESKAKYADDLNFYQAKQAASTAYNLNRTAQETEQRIQNNPTGPQVQIGVPGVASVRANPSQIRDSISNAWQFVSPIAPQPSTTQTPPVFQRYTPQSWAPSDAPQSLYSTP